MIISRRSFIYAIVLGVISVFFIVVNYLTLLGFGLSARLGWAGIIILMMFGEAYIIGAVWMFILGRDDISCSAVTKEPSMIHTKCGNEIVSWTDEEGRYWHPFFAGECPVCETAVTRSEVELYKK